MFRLQPGAIQRLLRGEPVSHRSTALLHASIHGRPGVRGDDPVRPSSVVWLRRGDGERWEGFAGGEPGPTLDRIAAKLEGATVALLAPDFWEDEVRRRGGSLDTATIRTFASYDLMMLPRFSAECRVLNPSDFEAFGQIAPAWALRSWGDFESMLEQGLALGLCSALNLVSVAWIYESTAQHDKIGVATLPRYRNLGLGKRVAGALIERLVNDRHKLPIWVTAAENGASIAVARALGFGDPLDETLLRWIP